MNLELKIRLQKIEDGMVHHGCKDSGPLLGIKNTVVVFVLIFIKYNGLCGITEKSQLCKKFCVCKNAACMHITCMVITMHTICRGLTILTNNI